MTKVKDSILLSPIRLHLQPDSQVEIVSTNVREELERVRADQNQRLSAGETARIMRVLDQSTGKVGCNTTGLTGFIGVVKHPQEGLMTVWGRGRQVGGQVDADGRFASRQGDILFQIETHTAGLKMAEKEYFRLVKNAGWRETTHVTLGYEGVIRARVKELKDDGRSVMYTTRPDIVEKIEVAPLVPRVFGRVAMQVGGKLAGQIVGAFGKVVKKENADGKMPIIKGLLQAE